MLSLEEIKGKTPEEIHALLANFQKKNLKIISDNNHKNEKLNQTIQTLDQKNKTLNSENQTLNLENKHLHAKLNMLLLQRYGKKSEKQKDILQGYLFDEGDLPEVDTEAEADNVAASDVVTIAAHKRAKRGRRPLPKDLPRIQHIHDLTEEEKHCACGHVLKQIGQETTEQLEFIPSQVRVIEHVQLKYACKHCEETIRLAKKPEQPIPKSIATAGLLSHVLVSKFCDHLPFYRQESILQRMNVDIGRNTLCNWALRCGELLSPLVGQMREQMLSYDIGYADETPVQVLKEPGRKPEARSYMWLFIGGEPDKRCYVYRYHPSRGHQIPEAFWEQFKGYLHTDGYSGYKAFARSHPVELVQCWAHARRKFADVIKATRKNGLAHKAVKFIAELYAIEKRCKREGHSPEEVYRVRQKKSKPLLEQFKRWLDANISKVPPKSLLGQAMGYSLRHWDNLLRYLDDGRLEIDNNRTERSIKPFVMGRKAWLFHDSPKGAKSGAVIYSLIETCKAHQVEPYAYLKYVLGEVVNCRQEEDYKKLLPFNIDQALLKKQWGVVG